MKRIKGAMVLGAAIAAVGCGSAVKSDVPAPATASEACVQLHDANARLSARCTGGALADWQAYWASQDDCAAYDRHVAEGKVEYRRQDWDTCLAAYDEPCDQIAVNCFWEVLHGLVPDGQPCQDTEVCGTVSACLPVSGVSAPCGTVCVSAGKENQPCGLYCGGATPCSTDIPICEWTLACVNGVCVKPRVAGQACGGSDPVPCAAILSCSADPADAQAVGTCKTRVAGGSCHGDADCIATEFCSQGTCTARRAVGESCADVSASCFPWTACDSSGTCAPAGRPGQACAPYPGTPGFLTCTVGSCFDGVSCSVFANIGESCASATCAPGLGCETTTLTCIAACVQ